MIPFFWRLPLVDKALVLGAGLVAFVVVFGSAVIGLGVVR
jgi:hypothetical protein